MEDKGGLFRKVHLHHPRASFITRTLGEGAKVSTVRDLASHSLIAVTNRYVSEASDEANRRVVNTLAHGAEGTARAEVHL